MAFTSLVTEKEFENAIIEIKENDPKHTGILLNISDPNPNPNPRNSYNCRLTRALEKNDVVAEVAFESFISDVDAAAIAEYLKRNSTLTSIYLRKNQISAAGVTAIAGSLGDNNTLISVGFEENNLGDTGVTAIAESLKSNKKLIYIYLQENQISDAGAVAIAEALKFNNTLTAIYLGNNRIGDAGVTAIAKALEENTAVNNIGLGENAIGDDGAIAIAEALRKNSAVASMNLARNRITNVGAASIAEALKENMIITSIDLARNSQIDSKTTAEINALLEMNKAFLRDAVKDFSEGRDLRDKQVQILQAHLNSNYDQNINSIFPQEMRKSFVSQEKYRMQFQELMASRKKDAIFSLGGGENFDRAENKAEFAQMEKKFPRFDLGLPDNVASIVEAVNLGMPFSQITRNLEEISKDNKAKDFALAHPEKLGYMVTLGKSQLDKAIKAINHPELSKDIEQNPEKIAKVNELIPEDMSKDIAKIYKIIPKDRLKKMVYEGLVPEDRLKYMPEVSARLHGKNLAHENSSGKKGGTGGSRGR